MKPQAEFGNFEALDIRIGKIINVEDAQTRKPTYRMTIDFGPDLGTKVSCGAYRNYTKEELIGQKIVAIVNFAPMKMGPEKSEVLVLGVESDESGTIYLTPQDNVSIGKSVF